MSSHRIYCCGVFSHDLLLRCLLIGFTVAVPSHRIYCCGAFSQDLLSLCLLIGLTQSCLACISVSLFYFFKSLDRSFPQKANLTVSMSPVAYHNYDRIQISVENRNFVATNEDIHVCA